VGRARGAIRGERTPELLVELAELNGLHDQGHLRALRLGRDAVAALAAAGRTRDPLAVRAAEQVVQTLVDLRQFAEAVEAAQLVPGPLFAPARAPRLPGDLTPLETASVALGHPDAALARLGALLPPGPPADHAAAHARGVLLRTIAELRAAAGQHPAAQRAYQQLLEEGVAIEHWPRTREERWDDLSVFGVEDCLAAELRWLGRDAEADRVDRSESSRVATDAGPASRPPAGGSGATALEAREQWFDSRGCTRQAMYYARRRVALLAGQPGREAEVMVELSRLSRWAGYLGGVSAPAETWFDEPSADRLWQLMSERWDRARWIRSELYERHELERTTLLIAQHRAARGQAAAARSLIGDAIARLDEGPAWRIDRRGASLTAELATLQALAGDLPAAEATLAAAEQLSGQSPHARLGAEELAHARGHFSTATPVFSLGPAYPRYAGVPLDRIAPPPPAEDTGI